MQEEWVLVGLIYKQPQSNDVIVVSEKFTDIRVEFKSVRWRLQMIQTVQRL